MVLDNMEDKMGTIAVCSHPGGQATTIHYLQRRIAMSVQLLIRDGDPSWWLSPDIWVVPGNDPNGAPGSPVAGLPAYLWTHVANTGDTDVNSVRVDFYWANPALQVLRSNSTLVGSAFADIPAGGSQDVLCLVAWKPAIVNAGHECLVTVANHSGDPLPDPLPDEFDPPAFRQVAQNNLSVLTVDELVPTAVSGNPTNAGHETARSTSPNILSALPYAITIQGWQRADKTVEVTAEVGGALDETNLERLGIKGLRPAQEEGLEVGLDHRPRYQGRRERVGPNKLERHVPRGTSAAVYALIRANKLMEGEYQLVNITERSEDRVLGGLGFIIIPASKERQS
jgi:hypothetical protein